MKLKNILLIIGLFTTVAGTLQGQTNYYKETKTFYEDGYTYQCDVPESKLVVLYNKANVHTYERYANKDGSRVSSDVLLGRVRLIEHDDWTRSKCGEIALKFFTPGERVRIAGDDFGVSMTIDTNTGKVIEVDFSFYHTDPITTIPVSVFRQIELELKDKIWFTPTAEGRKLKFIQRGWWQKIDEN